MKKDWRCTWPVNSYTLVKILKSVQCMLMSIQYQLSNHSLLSQTLFYSSSEGRPDESSDESAKHSGEIKIKKVKRKPQREFESTLAKVKYTTYIFRCILHSMFHYISLFSCF